MNPKPKSPVDPARLLPKILGGDFELGNVEEGSEGRPSAEPAEAVLAEIEGVPAFRGFTATVGGSKWKPRPGGAFRGPVVSPSQAWVAPGNGTSSANWQTTETLIDRGRKYLSGNGGCIYIDSMHLELAFPETRGARDFVAAHRDMLAIATRALHAANAKRDSPDGRIRLLTSNSDGHGNAWGTHLDFLVSREAFANVMDRRMHYQAFLASVHAAGVVFGQGKVGAETFSPISYQLAQRMPDFFSKVATLDTMCGAHRGLVNTRDEPLCRKREDELARYHCIPYDHTLCRYADWLKVGHLQLVLSMIEAEWVPCDLILEDPPQAAHDWGRDQTLFDRRPDPVESHRGEGGARARLITGELISLATYHARLAVCAREYHEAAPDLIESLIPDAGAVLEAWEETARRLGDHDTVWLSRRFDAWLKHGTLMEALRQNPALNWTSPALKALDHLYGELPDGLFFQLERAGEVETILPGVTNPLADELSLSAPQDTRAGVRAKLLSLIPKGDVVRVNWDEVAFEWDGKVYCLSLPDPAMRISPPLAAATSTADIVALFGRSSVPKPEPVSPASAAMTKLPVSQPPPKPSPARLAPPLQAPRCEVRVIESPMKYKPQKNKPKLP